MGELNLGNSKEKTKEHIKNVASKLYTIVLELQQRAENHDKSKLESPEVEIFDEYTEKLKTSTYGSNEYKQFLKEMKPALDHHYANNRHHSEFHPEGIYGMNLVDIIEMFCDWLAATERHDDGNIYKSIEINKERFEMTEQLSCIFRNTAKDIFYKEQENNV